MNLTAFLAENAVKPESAFYAASARFLSQETDENGRRKPMQWEIQPITGEEDEKLRKLCLKRVPVPGNRGMFQRELDTDLYYGKLAVACTVFPNLNDQALQDSYHVRGAEALLKTMLTPGEYTDYFLKVQEVCGFHTMQEDIDEAKN